MRAWIRIVAASLAAGCGAEQPRGVILELSSDLRVPEEIDEVIVRVKDASGAMMLDKRYLLHGPEKVNLPGRLGLETAGDLPEPLDIQAIARKGHQPIVLKTVRVDRHREKPVVVELNRDCFGILCPEGLTCMSGGLCVRPGYPHQPDPTGPGCSCRNYFPMCVGATWTYDEIYSEGKAKVANYKKWSIARYGTIGDPAHGKRDVNAFLQVRPSALDFSHKWISVVGNPRVLYWEKEDQFSKELERRNTTYFVSETKPLNLGKIRFNEGLSASADEPFVERYTQFDYIPGRREPIEMACEDRWYVMALDDVRRLEGAHFPDRFAKGDIVCHRRMGRETNPPPPDLTPDQKAVFERESDKIFCFMRGMGKVYERSLKPVPAEEVLVEFNNPAACVFPL